MQNLWLPNDTCTCFTLPGDPYLVTNRILSFSASHLLRRATPRATVDEKSAFKVLKSSLFSIFLLVSAIVIETSRAKRQ